MQRVGITERGDAAINLDWVPWVEAGNPTILISKAPIRVYDHLKPIANRNVIVHATITGFGSTKLEPNVMVWTNTIIGYQALIHLLGEERVILRIDPIIPTDKGIAKALKILEQANPSKNQRVRISFFDNYPHVKERFKQAGLPQLDYDFHAPLDIRTEIYHRISEATPATVEVCGEPGFPCTGCISAKDCEILGVTPSDGKSKQRGACACLSMKQELLSNKHRCAHNCLYCYWKD